MMNLKTLQKSVGHVGQTQCLQGFQSARHTKRHVGHEAGAKEIRPTLPDTKIDMSVGLKHSNCKGLPDMPDTKKVNLKTLRKKRPTIRPSLLGND